MATDNDKRAKEIRERRDASREYLKSSGLYDEWTEVFRAYKCKTKPIMVRNTETGKDEEDKTRTNVAMPDISLMARKNTARQTAQPPKNRYIGGSDPLVADKLTALSYVQFDRSGEYAQHRRLVMQAELLGWACSKTFYDTITVGRNFRYDREKFRDRTKVMQMLGAAPDEIEQAVAQFGESLTDEEVQQAIATKGPELRGNVNIKKYEGPVTKALFAGDVFLEPGCLTLNDSSYVIEQYTETDLWLQKLAKRTYIDPDTGEEQKVCDPKAVQELLDSDCYTEDDAKVNDLRQLFRSTVGADTPKMEKRLLPGKRFNIIECHETGDDGRLWINWVGNEKYVIGKMPYPVDLYGKYYYTELNPLPDIISCYGDSTPRLLRHLYYLHNLTVGQNFDYVTNLLKVYLLLRRNVDVSFEDRGPWRALTASDINGITPLNMPQIPAGAFERESQILRMMSMAEPSMMNTDAGSAANPMAGKTATTAILANKSADALTQFKIEGLNIYLKEKGEKQLWMNQQLREMGDPWEISPKYPRSEALSERYGKTSVITLDPLEIQEDLEVEPEEGSMLAVDDELRRQAAQELDQIAMSAPGVLDLKKVVRFHLSTIRGIGNPDDYILPDQQGTQPPPFKGNINIALPFDKLPSDVQNQLLPMFGLQPSKELENRDTMNAVKELAAAGNAAADLTSPAVTPQEGVPAEVTNRTGGVSSNG